MLIYHIVLWNSRIYLGIDYLSFEIIVKSRKWYISYLYRPPYVNESILCDILNVLSYEFISNNNFYVAYGDLNRDWPWLASGNRGFQGNGWVSGNAGGCGCGHIVTAATLSCLHSLLGYSTGEFQALQLIVLAAFGCRGLTTSPLYVGPLFVLEI